MAFVLACLTVVFAVIGLALDARINGSCNSGFSGTGSTFCGATGVGITAGVLGIVFGGLAIIYLMVSGLWDKAFMRMLVVGGLILTTIMALVAGILNAYVAAQLVDSYYKGMTGAASAMHFMTMFMSFGTAMFSLNAATATV